MGAVTQVIPHNPGRSTLTLARLLFFAAVVLSGCGGEGGVRAPDEGEGDSTTIGRSDGAAPSVDPRGDSVAGAATTFAPLTPDGWGPLRIGMTRREVVDAIGDDASPNTVGGPEPEVCDEWRPERAPAGLMTMVERDTLTRITLLDRSEIATESGVRVGDPASKVRAAYGAEVEETPHKYMDAPAAYITVWKSGPGTPRPRGLVYEIGLEGTVTHIRAGGPSIQYVEGCL